MEAGKGGERSASAPRPSPPSIQEQMVLHLQNDPRDAGHFEGEGGRWDPKKGKQEDERITVEPNTVVGGHHNLEETVVHSITGRMLQFGAPAPEGAFPMRRWSDGSFLDSGEQTGVAGEISCVLDYGADADSCHSGPAGVVRRDVPGQQRHAADPRKHWRNHRPVSVSAVEPLSQLAGRDRRYMSQPTPAGDVLKAAPEG